MPPSSAKRPVALFRLACCLSLLVCAGLFVLWSWRWPLFGDASLIHYICFLMDCGFAPYRDLGDMNMPGSFLIERSVMHSYGMGDLAWRLFDFTLLGVAGVAMFSIARTYDWLAAVFAAVLLALTHGQDGLAQTGQRDLTMAVLLLLATACLIEALRRRSPLLAALFGLFAGVALTIKPTALPFALGLLLLAAWTLHRRGQPMLRYELGSLAAMLIGPMIAFVFLLREHCLDAFLAGLHGIVPFYAGLAHRPLGFLLLHSVSPLLPLVILWVVLLAVARPALSWERTALLAGVLFGLISYIVQARGYPYYRYPLLVFLLPLIAIDLTTALRSVKRSVQGIAIFGLACGAFFVAPAAARLIHVIDPHSLDFIDSLQADLSRLGGQSLSGQVQCIDSISGCGSTLYRMRLVQSTGVLSDFLLFGPDDVPVVQQTRAELMRKLATDPPRVMIVSGRLHLDGPDGFRKLARWPAFEQALNTQYCLAKQWNPTRQVRAWSRREWPDSYRIYLLRSAGLCETF